ncbi:hypothetical protein KJ365_13990 [Glaciecola sp. XM2]|jgi:hypothetical protein|uniref:hypothetical protein n=1 Tax=Glaciecola sp. XM2 TaxID=1914931 RepID=UPI001BDF32EF|nr:hypothetical protein [Glaciecola sp. XM2]MBT1452000.1 hypothetical protein [Glaciecola sp. XM2]
MLQQELDTLMQETAEDAVKTSQEQFGISLDYSAASIDQVDATITRFVKEFPSQSLENKAIFTICNMYGAYIGEVFKELAGGQWHYDTSAPEAPTIFLKIKDKSYAFAGVCYDKLVKNPDIQVGEYFQKALAANTN